MELGVYRDGMPTTLPITIGELDLENQGQVAEAEIEVEDLSTGFGMNLQDLTTEVSRQLELPAGTTGAIVSGVDPGGAAQQGGIRPGDVITAVNRSPVGSATEAIQELNQVEAGRTAFLLILRGESQVFLRIRKE